MGIHNADEPEAGGGPYEDLWNDQLRPQAGAEEKYHELVLEQYKAYIATTESTSDRRLRTNTFLITLNTGLIAGVSYVFSEVDTIIARLFALVVVAAGFALSITWCYLLRSYRDINSAKFIVVGRLEQRLPASPFWNDEWKQLKPKYIPLTVLEGWIPKLMLIVYLVVFGLGCYSIYDPESAESPPKRFNVNLNAPVGPPVSNPPVTNPPVTDPNSDRQAGDISTEPSPAPAADPILEQPSTDDPIVEPPPVADAAKELPPED